MRKNNHFSVRNQEKNKKITQHMMEKKQQLL